MIMKRLVLIIVAAAVLVFAACSEDRELFSSENVGRLVVDATLHVDRKLPEVVLYRAPPASEVFDLTELGETGATVKIHQRRGTVEYLSLHFGVYTPDLVGNDSLDIVLPGTTYRLEVVTTSGEILTATTTTPPRMKVSDWVLLDDSGEIVTRKLRTFEEAGDGVYSEPENQLYYLEGLLEARWEALPVVAYQAGVYSLDLDSGLAIDPEYLEEDDLDDFERNISSPLILPAENSIRLPWFAIYFHGRYKIKIFAVDRNWYDLARSVPELGGGGGGAFGGNAGDNFTRPIFNVSGGIGLFASVSMDSVGFFVRPRR